MSVDIEGRKRRPAAAGWGGSALRLRNVATGQAPGGAASVGLSSATAQPAWGPRRGFEPGWPPDLRFLVLGSTARSDIGIVAVGHADPGHVVIVLAPCIIAAAANDVSLEFHVCVLWYPLRAYA
jgi:hypothetical protein